MTLLFRHAIAPDAPRRQMPLLHDDTRRKQAESAVEPFRRAWSRRARLASR